MRVRVQFGALPEHLALLGTIYAMEPELLTHSVGKHADGIANRHPDELTSESYGNGRSEDVTLRRASAQACRSALLY